MLFLNKHFRIERISRDERKYSKIILLIPNFQTTMEYLLEVHRATLPNLVAKLPTTVDCQAENTTRAVMWKSFHLAETKYRIIVCNLSKSDLQYL